MQFRCLRSRDRWQSPKHVQGRERSSALGRGNWSPTASEEEEELGRPPFGGGTDSGPPPLTRWEGRVLNPLRPPDPH